MCNEYAGFGLTVLSVNKWTNWRDTGVQYLFSPERAQDEHPNNCDMIKLRKSGYEGSIRLAESDMAELEALLDERVVDFLRMVAEETEGLG